MIKTAKITSNSRKDHNGKGHLSDGEEHPSGSLDICVVLLHCSLLLHRWRKQNITAALKGGKHPADTETQAWQDMVALRAVLPSPFTIVTFSRRSIPPLFPSRYLSDSLHLGLEGRLMQTSWLSVWGTISGAMFFKDMDWEGTKVSHHTYIQRETCDISRYVRWNCSCILIMLL